MPKPTNFHPQLDYSESVREALSAEQPIVALESSIISQGLPYPYNYETALELEECVKQMGCTPATIGILDGKIRIGLTPDQLLFFSSNAGIYKINAQEIPIAIAKGWNGATTVSGTLVCAKLASIEVLATGGIGGIHRDFSHSHDISGDLQQIANTQAIIVCSGVKAILDIPRTLEMLETLGVIVGTFDNDEFPAFWSRNSGNQTPVKLTSVEEIVAIYSSAKLVNHGQGFLVANPVPATFEIPRDVIEPIIEESLAKARQQEIKGKALTPYLLNSIYNLSSGMSINTNIELVKNNAILASRIANKLVSI